MGQSSPGRDIAEPQAQPFQDPMKQLHSLKKPNKSNKNYPFSPSSAPQKLPRKTGPWSPGSAGRGMPPAWVRMGALPRMGPLLCLEEPEEPSGLGAERDGSALPSAGCTPLDGKDADWDAGRDAGWCQMGGMLAGMRDAGWDAG